MILLGIFVVVAVVLLIISSSVWKKIEKELGGAPLEFWLINKKKNKKK